MLGAHPRELPPIQGGEDDPDALRAEIAETRSELSETIDAIQERLGPEHVKAQADALKDQATDTIREATVGKAEQMVTNEQEIAKGMGETIKEARTMRRMLIGFGGLVLLGWVLWLIRRQRSVPLKLEQIQTQGQRLTQALTALRSGQVSPEQVLAQIRTQSQRLTEALGALQRSGQGNPQQVLGQLREQSRRLTQAITGVQQVLSRRAKPGPLDEQPPAG
jgi:hypothetical protein